MTAVTSADQGRDDQPAVFVGDEPPESGAGTSVTARAAVAVLVGVAGLLLGFAHLDRVQMWALEYGRAWVYLGFFMYASVFGRVFWWGVDTLIAEYRTGRSRRGDVLAAGE